MKTSPLFLLSLAACLSTRAVPLTWDADGAGPGTGGVGTWDTVSPTWGAGTAAWPSTGDDNLALFAGTPGAVTIASGGVAAWGLSFQTNGYQIVGAPLTLNGVGPFLEVGPGFTATNSVILAGTAGLRKDGAGLLHLTNTGSTYTGDTVVRAGTLRSQGVGSVRGTVTLGDAGTGTNSVAWLFNGGTSPGNLVNVSSNGTGTVTLGTYSGGTFTQPNGPLALNRAVTLVDGTGDRTSFNGLISGSPGLITIAGTRITFGGANNTFVGNLDIPVGRIFQCDAVACVPSTTRVINNGSFRLNNAARQNIDGLDGSGTVTIIAGGAAILGLGYNQGNGDHSGVISNGASALSLVKSGTGVQTLRGASTFTGGVTVSQGELRIGSNGGAGTGTLTLGDAGSGAQPVIVTLQNRADILNPVLVSSNATGVVVVGGDLTGSGNNAASYLGTLTLQRPVIFRSTVPDRLALDGKITGNAGLVTIDGGARTTWANAANDFVGDVLVTGTNTILQTAVASVGSTIPDSASVTVDAGAFLHLAFTPAGVEVINGLNGAGTVRTFPTALAAATLAVGAAGGDGNFTGVLRDGANPLSFRKTGAGTQTLSGANLYTGSTVVTQGVLRVTGSIRHPASPLDIGPGATLHLDGGALTASNLLVRAGGLLTGCGAITGAVVNAGTVALDCGGTLAVTGSFTNDGRLRLVNGGSISASGGLVNNGVLDLITANQTLPAGLVNNGTLFLSDSVLAANPRDDAGVFRVSIASQPGHGYQLQRADAPGSATWQDIGPTQDGIEGTLDFADPAPGAGGVYRIRVNS